MSKYIVERVSGGMQAVTPRVMAEMYAAMSADERLEFTKLLQASEKEKPDLPPDEVWVNVAKGPGYLGSCYDSKDAAEKRPLDSTHRAVSYIRRDAILAALPDYSERYVWMDGLRELLESGDE